MEILDVIGRVIEKKVFSGTDFYWCFIDQKKAPMKSNGSFAKPNNKGDFVDLYSLIDNVEDFSNFKGIGFSVNFSKVSAIDIDKCVEIPFNINSINQQGKDLLEMFKDYYCEFSFSGTGLRIILKTTIEGDYKNNYYIKNSSNNIEFYDHTFPARYVTMTGISIYDNELKEVDNELFKTFLNTYMKRMIKTIDVKSESTIDEIEVKKRLKKLLLTNSVFQEKYFSNAPGSNSDESERDFFLIATVYEEISTDYKIIKGVLDISPYCESKDTKHKRKWNETDYVRVTIDGMRKR